jgi:hypothetical protein
VLAKIDEMVSDAQAKKRAIEGLVEKLVEFGEHRTGQSFWASLYRSELFEQKGTST